MRRRYKCLILIYTFYSNFSPAKYTTCFRLQLTERKVVRLEEGHTEIEVETNEMSKESARNLTWI